MNNDHFGGIIQSKLPQYHYCPKNSEKCLYLVVIICLNTVLGAFAASARFAGLPTHQNSSIHSRKNTELCSAANSFFSGHGSFAMANLQSLCPTLQRQPLGQVVSIFRPISLHGICSAGLSRKFARHRNLSTGTSKQTLSCPNTGGVSRNTLAYANQERD